MTGSVRIRPVTYSSATQDQRQTLWRQARDHRLALHWCAPLLRSVPPHLAYSCGTPPMGSAGVGKTTTLSAARTLPDNCRCVHLISCRRPDSPSTAWLWTALSLTLLFVGLLPFQSIRTSTNLTTPELRLNACGSARTLDCCALPAETCECWPPEPHLTPHPPVVANSCPNPRAHKTEVHYQRGTLVESRPCWQVVPFPNQNPSFPYTSPAKLNKWLSGWNHLYIVTSSHEPTSGHVMMSYSKKQWKTDGRDQW